MRRGESYSFAKKKQREKLLFPPPLPAVLLLLFYPVVPLAAYLNLLWKHPKRHRSSRKERLAFRDSERAAATAHSVAGGIESPVQFVLQLWLILNGKIAIPWDQRGKLTLRDWHGNELHLPTTAAISLVLYCFFVAFSAFVFIVSVVALATVVVVVAVAAVAAVAPAIYTVVTTSAAQ